MTIVAPIYGDILDPAWGEDVTDQLNGLTDGTGTATAADVVVAGRSLPRGIMGVPVTSASNGTATAADTVEVADAVLGSYTFTAVTGRRYRVHYHGALANSGTVNCRMITRVRDGGASTPTTSSTLIAEVATYLTETAGSGRASIDVIRTFTATSGVHTLRVFTQSPDSAAMTPVPSSVASGREFYVEDIGPST